MLSELWEIYETALLALVIWREARGEGEIGMRAVACSIRNRVLRPSWWGASYGSVIGKKFQYSSMAAPGDPQLIRYPDADDPSFAAALEIADDLIQHNPLVNPVPGADSFYDISISAPDWATPDRFVAQVGRLRFFNVDHDFESPITTKPAPIPPPVVESKPAKSWWEKVWG